MAQSQHLGLAEGKFGDAGDGSRVVVEESIGTIESSTFYTAKEEASSSGTEESMGCVSLPSCPTNSGLEYFSSRIHSMIEGRSEFATALEAEIEASKWHWSELEEGNGETDIGAANLKVFRSLQEQYGGPEGFFKDLGLDDAFALGEKIAEGGQGEIFHVKYRRLPQYDDICVLKVFNEGSSLEVLKRQWPPGMLLKCLRTSGGFYRRDYAGMLFCGTMLGDGRFAFLLMRFWGDLRKVIDVKMQHNRNRAAPFSDMRALEIMHGIARGMRGLHEDGIVHRDLKASNVLILPHAWLAKDAQGKFDLAVPYGEFDPVMNKDFVVAIADFECSVGVVGTRFWRAPEILGGVKSRCVVESLFTKKSDVYSYAMTCYEVLTGKIPLEDLPRNDYDAILVRGERPVLPRGIEPWVKSLLERCWHQDPSQRPSFQDLVPEFEGRKIGFCELV